MISNSDTDCDPGSDSDLEGSFDSPRCVGQAKAAP
jgi:hypothetical protein